MRKYIVPFPFVCFIFGSSFHEDVLFVNIFFSLVTAAAATDTAKPGNGCDGERDSGGGGGRSVDRGHRCGHVVTVAMAIMMSVAVAVAVIFDPNVELALALSFNLVLGWATS